MGIILLGPAAVEPTPWTVVIQNMGRALVFLLLVGLIVLLAVGLFRRPTDGTGRSPLVGRMAPPFELQLFGGGTLKSTDLRGKAVMLNFWASWCEPCRSEARAIERAWQRYRELEAVFIGANIWDDPDSARQFLSRYGGSYPSGSDPKGRIAVDYGVAGVPETFFIDANGRIVDKYSGPLTEELIDAYMSRALDPSPGPEEVEGGGAQ